METRIDSDTFVIIKTPKTGIAMRIKGLLAKLGVPVKIIIVRPSSPIRWVG